MFLFLNIQNIMIVEIAISARAISHDTHEVPNHPNLTFIPKKLAINVGGISISETRVNTFMILFWSRLMIPSTVFWRYSSLSKLKLVWLISDEMSFRRTFSFA